MVKLTVGKEVEFAINDPRHPWIQQKYENHQLAIETINTTLFLLNFIQP